MMHIQKITMVDFGDILVTRKMGEQIRQRIVTVLERNGVPESLLLDFNKVRIIDYSCADELVARMAVELIAKLHGDRYLILSGLNETLRENVEVALKQRELALLTWDQGQWQVIGELRSYLQPGLNLINDKGIATARDLADNEDLAINTASNRLTELSKLGLTQRSEGMASSSRQYYYRSILPQE